MTIPSWLLAIAAWSLMVLGTVGLLTAIVTAIYFALDHVYQRSRLSWEFALFLHWRKYRRNERPDLAEQLDAAEARADRAEDLALRGEADGIFRSIRELDMAREEHVLDLHTRDWLDALRVQLEERGQKKLAEWKRRHE